MRTLLTIVLFNFFTKTVLAQADACNCPRPESSQYEELANSLFTRKEAGNSAFSYRYQELLWTMACADLNKDSREVAEAKVRCMWNKYREEFICRNFPTVLATDKNVLKFAMDVGYSGFVVEMVKRYKCDVNFVEPGDRATIMDFILRRISEMKNSPPVDQLKINEYQRVYDFLRKNGAKHAKELEL